MGNYNQDLKERGGGSNMYLTVPPHSVFAVCTVQYLFIGTVHTSRFSKSVCTSDCDTIYTIFSAPSVQTQSAVRTRFERLAVRTVCTVPCRFCSLEGGQNVGGVAHVRIRLSEKYRDFALD